MDEHLGVQVFDKGPASSESNFCATEPRDRTQDYPLTIETDCNTDHGQLEDPDASFSTSRPSRSWTSPQQHAERLQEKDRLTTPLLYIGAHLDAVSFHRDEPFAQATSLEDSIDLDDHPPSTPDAQDSTTTPERQVSAADETQMISVNALPTFDYQRPCIIVYDDQGRATVPVADDVNPQMKHDDLLSLDILIKDIHWLVDGLNSQWMVKLGPEHEIFEIYKGLSTGTLFDIGVETLRRCYTSGFPDTFREIFALMHVAFAFSHIIFKDGSSCYWDGFSHDVYWWYLALPNPTEASLFLRVWHRLWCSQATSSVPSQDNCLFNAEAHATFAGRPPCPHAPPLHAVPETHKNVNVKSWRDPKQRAFKEILMGGMVIGGCSRFLDREIAPHDLLEIAPNVQIVIEYANLQSHGGLERPLCENHDHLIESIVRPLQRCHATRLIPEQIAETVGKINSGVLHNVREVEVTLKCAPEVCLGPGDPMTND